MPRTVEFQFEVPYFLLIEMLAGDTLIGGGMSVGMYQNRSFGCYAPAHYLKQFLPKYSSEAQVNARARRKDSRTGCACCTTRRTGTSIPSCR